MYILSLQRTNTLIKSLLKYRHNFHYYYPNVYKRFVAPEKQKLLQSLPIQNHSRTLCKSI